jgi:3-deoxy-manno-octulosonate cytidylyltransferase (CMP-KDO synthetase)
VYRRAREVSSAAEVIVATDDRRIADEILDIGGQAQMTASHHTNGTTRITEIAATLDYDVVINLQGDEPLIQPELIEELIDALQDPSLDLATFKKAIDRDSAEDPNIVKVITDIADNALYFSRLPIPYNKNGGPSKYFKHIGLYGFQRHVLLDLMELPRTDLDQIEDLEQLKWIAHGYKIKVIQTEYDNVSIDVPQDLQTVKRFLAGGRPKT